MNKIIALVLIISGIGYASITGKPKAMDDPYDLQLQIKQTENNKFILVASMELDSGSYFGSPLSNNNFTGLFTISFEENHHLTMEDTIIEIPRSKEVIDYFENVPVNWVWENTTYQRHLNILSQDDFEVTGLVSFTIEPRCTMEEINFTISYQSGKMKIIKTD